METALDGSQVSPIRRERRCWRLDPVSANQLRHIQRLAGLRTQLGPYCPTSVTANDLAQDNLPSILAQAIYLALKDGLSDGLMIQPVANFTYADYQQMVTVTAVVWPQQELAQHLESSRLESWAFFCGRPSDVLSISVPVLSARERTELDRIVIIDGNDNMNEDVLHVLDVVRPEEVEQYRRFQRYYPYFARVAG